MLAVSLLSCGLVAAEPLHVRVYDADQQPVPDVAIFVVQDGVGSTGEPEAAVMDQRDQRFVPHVLVVQKGAAVSFPNSDVVAHHVYSFSRPNQFVLPLYKGTLPEPITLEHDGIVTLGCNIHDNMLGYIAVVDTSTFGKTGDDGSLTLDVDEAARRWIVRAWSPRFREKNLPLELVVENGEEMTATFVVTERLRPPHDEHSESVEWQDYD